VQACPECGRENPDGFAYCGYCTAPLTELASGRRKLATLVFCDVAGSTAIGERLDPESVRELMGLYFREMRSALERHGGSVEKFIGDAVVAVFGVPEANEDDALRACRAALEMQTRLTDLNEELERRFDARLAARIGVNTGEVVGSRETLITGDAVNVAARLEQAAPPGEVLLGETTYRLVRHAVSVEQVEAVSAKGKSEPLAAYRLLDVPARHRPSRVGTPIVGRDAELALLEHEFDVAASHQCCRLVTVIGEPGVGKSRLTAELVDRIAGSARFARGACLSYGEGITFWPLAQIVRDLAGIRDEDSAEEARARVPQRVAQLIGLAEGSTISDQNAEAVASFLAAAAAAQPIVIVVDDIHWAEPALLELLAGLPARAGEAPILLLCLARPELLEARPDWPVTMRLQPLGAADVDELLDRLEAPAAVRVRLAQTAGGNPLYAEELVAWVREGGELDEMPTTLNALLGARLDRLEGRERDALERGAIEGELFHQEAIEALSEEPVRGSVSGELGRLERKELIRLAAASMLAGSVAYRFKHILVREAAYRATAKRLRALLHERYADWLERVAGERVGEYHEILGYHFEQAYRYRAELGPVGDDDRALAARAGSHLGKAGRRANDRGDVHAAANLLGRATALLPAEGLERLELLIPYSYAVAECGRVFESREIDDELDELATAAGERRLAARARLNRLPSNDPEVDYWGITEPLIETFTELGDEVGLARALRGRAATCRARGRMVEAQALFERALVHANSGRDLVTCRVVTQGLSMVLCHGSTPVRDATPRCEALREANRDDRVLGAVITRHLSSLYAMAGRFDDARESWEGASRVLDEANMVVSSWVSHIHSSMAKELAGDRAGAQSDLKTMWLNCREVLGGAPDLRAMGAAYMLAWLYCDDGRWDEADEYLAFNREVRVPEDFAVAVYRLAGEARLAAHRGELVEAAMLARRAVEFGEGADMPNVRARAWLALAEVQRAAGHAGHGDAAVGAALELYVQKGNVAAADRLRAGVPSV
jgi:class 3 adenylate cyclase/tetratricopeptide (TPR) repeat protein